MKHKNDVLGNLPFDKVYNIAKEARDYIDAEEPCVETKIQLERYQRQIVAAFASMIQGNAISNQCAAYFYFLIIEDIARRCTNSKAGYAEVIHRDFLTQYSIYLDDCGFDRVTTAKRVSDYVNEYLAEAAESM